VVVEVVVVVDCPSEVEAASELPVVEVAAFEVEEEEEEEEEEAAVGAGVVWFPAMDDGEAPDMSPAD